MIATADVVPLSPGDIFDARAVDSSFPGSILGDSSLSEFVTFPSARAALTFALDTSSIQSDDEVLLPAYTCYAVREAVSQVATPRFVDVDPETYNIDLDAAERAVTDRTEAIVPVHMYGNPVDSSSLRSFADDHNLLVFEDAAQALGATVTSGGVGTLGDYCVYSFRFTKEATCYKGGLLLTDEETAAGVRSSLGFPIGKLFAVVLLDGALSSLPGPLYQGLREKVLDPLFQSSAEDVGSRSPRAFSDRQRALLTWQLEQLEKRVETRRDRARQYHDELPFSVDKPASGSGHTYFKYPVQVPADRRDSLYASLQRRGVGCSKMYSYTLSPDGTCPNADELAERVIVLPIHGEMTSRQVTAIADAFHELW